MIFVFQTERNNINCFDPYTNNERNKLNVSLVYYFIPELNTIFILVIVIVGYRLQINLSLFYLVIGIADWRIQNNKNQFLITLGDESFKIHSIYCNDYKKWLVFITVYT